LFEHRVRGQNNLTCWTKEMHRLKKPKTTLNSDDHAVLNIKAATQSQKDMVDVIRKSIFVITNT
jgi:hypothetical protein